jgi:hypothetical protein
MVGGTGGCGEGAVRTAQQRRQYAARLVAVTKEGLACRASRVLAETASSGWAS